MADAIFFNLIDVAGIAAYIIWTTKNAQWNDKKLYRQRLFLQQLGRNLVDSHLNQRCQNACVVQRGVRLAMCSLGLSMTQPIRTISASSGKQRCYICPRIRDRKVATKCSTCHSPCCPDHHKTICDICLELFDVNKKKKE